MVSEENGVFRLLGILGHYWPQNLNETTVKYVSASWHQVCKEVHELTVRTSSRIDKIIMMWCGNNMKKFVGRGWRHQFRYSSAPFTRMQQCVSTLEIFFEKTNDIKIFDNSYMRFLKAEYNMGKLFSPCPLFTPPSGSCSIGCQSFWRQMLAICRGIFGCLSTTIDSTFYAHQVERVLSSGRLCPGYLLL